MIFKILLGTIILAMLALTNSSVYDYVFGNNNAQQLPKKNGSSQEENSSFKLVEMPDVVGSTNENNAIKQDNIQDNIDLLKNEDRESLDESVSQLKKQQSQDNIDLSIASETLKYDKLDGSVEEHQSQVLEPVASAEQKDSSVINPPEVLDLKDSPKAIENQQNEELGLEKN